MLCVQRSTPHTVSRTSRWWVHIGCAGVGSSELYRCGLADVHPGSALVFVCSVSVHKGNYCLRREIDVWGLLCKEAISLFPRAHSTSQCFHSPVCDSKSGCGVTEYRQKDTWIFPESQMLCGAVVEDMNQTSSIPTLGGWNLNPWLLWQPLCGVCWYSLGFQSQCCDE